MRHAFTIHSSVSSSISIHPSIRPSVQLFIHSSSAGFRHGRDVPLNRDLQLATSVHQFYIEHLRAFSTILLISLPITKKKKNKKQKTVTCTYEIQKQNRRIYVPRDASNPISKLTATPGSASEDKLEFTPVNFSGVFETEGKD